MRKIISWSVLVIVIIILFGYGPSLNAQDKAKVGDRKEAADPDYDLDKMPDDLLVEDEPEDKTGATLRGRVYYRDTGKPVRRGWIGFKQIKQFVKTSDGIVVEKDAFGLHSGYSTDNETLTGQNGEYTAKYVKPGVYLPILRVPGVLNPTPSDLQNSLFQKIIVPDERETRQDIAVVRGAAISGRVLYADGEPVIGTQVKVLRPGEEIIKSYYDERDHALITDDRGAYRFTGLPAGKYRIVVTEQTLHGGSEKETVPGNRFYNPYSALKTFYPGVGDVKEAVIIQAELGREQTGINITLPERQFFSISGTVVAQDTQMPVKGMEVVFSNAQQSTGKTIADEQGRWSFTDLPQGKYTIRVAESYRSAGKKIDRPKYAPATKVIEIRDQNLSDIRFEPAPEAVISGEIVVEGGTAVPRYTSLVALSRSATDEEQWSSVGDADVSRDQGEKNSFRIGELPAGEYFLKAVTGYTREAEYYVKSIRLGDRDLTDSPLRIETGEKIGGVRIVLAIGTGTLKGKIRDFSPNRETGAMLISVAESKWSRVPKFYEAPLAADGSFELQVAPGKYYLVLVTGQNKPNPQDIIYGGWLDRAVKDARVVTVGLNETNEVLL